ncbi:hypothetical protein [Methylobacterium sp. 275MFSha3.1]|uniref:hypothetical protein n=1 Tax=Methylobacterium sp. 275MFSha3.1 TaxID=1502746 RepID=UPI00111512C3|nr:hypothetical protein [Methylobacterium sp. 275MFSha3.1]
MNPDTMPRAPSPDRGREAVGPRKATAARRTAVAPVPLASPAVVQPGGGATRRVDLLAAERGNDRITEAQYLVGRMIQAAFERGSGARLGSGTWNDAPASGTSAAQDLAMILKMEDAERIRRFMARLEQEIGRSGARFLRAILADGHTFKSYAAARGRTGEMGVRSIAEHFRLLLEALTEAQHTATGPNRSPIRGGPC